MSSSSIRPRASMSASVAYEWLWCDDHVKITQWFLAQPRLTYKQFYASFINFANRVWELSRQQERAPLKGLEKFIVELLQRERIPADELLTALQEYSAGLGEGKSRWKENGLVAFSEGLSHEALIAGKNKLHAKVMTGLRKSKNARRVARLQATSAAAATTTNKATMANQQLLPAFVAPSRLPAYVAPSPLSGWLAPSSLPMPVPSPRGLALAWDPFVHSEQPLSLGSVEEAIGNLGPAAASDKQAQKATTLSAPVNFGSLPLAGGKKANEEEEMGDEDMVL